MMAVKILWACEGSLRSAMGNYKPYPITTRYYNASPSQKVVFQLTPLTHSHDYRVDSDRAGSCLSNVLKASVRGVYGVPASFATPVISGRLPCARAERDDMLIGMSSDESLCVARSSRLGIIDQMPRRRLSKKINLGMEQVRTFLWSGD
jgi:hypothetical protein